MRTLYAHLHVAPLSRLFGTTGALAQGPTRRCGKGNSDVAIGFGGEDSAPKANLEIDQLRR
ncbi:MAG: hypothetical protein U0441_31180 [Polyangiaceae bacterium]